MDEKCAVAKFSERTDGPKLALSYGNNPAIVVDVGFFDRIFSADDEIAFCVNELVFLQRLRSGGERISALVAALAPYTLTQRIIDQDSLIHARKMVFEETRPQCLRVAGCGVALVDAYVVVGKESFLVDDVLEYFFIGAHVPVAGGLVPAALIMAAVAAERRPDLGRLAETRVRVYESQSGDDPHRS